MTVENDAGDVIHSVRPRQLALLAILAASGRKGIGREKALGILWSDSSPDRARHALSQTLYSLRRELDTDAIISTTDLRLDPGKITSDVSEFRDAIASADWQKASILYAGPFLEGFYLGEAPDFERWSEAERSDLALHGLRAIESVAVDLEQSGKLHVRGLDANGITPHHRRSFVRVAQLMLDLDAAPADSILLEIDSVIAEEIAQA